MKVFRSYELFLIFFCSVRAAFDRLISTNLPLKYAITGHISPFERLPNGFCDMGGLKIAEDLKFPKDLKWDNHDHRKKVLLLNLGHCEIDPAIVANNVSCSNLASLKIYVVSG